MAFESGFVPEDWRSFHCTRVKERGQSVAIMEVLAC